MNAGPPIWLITIGIMVGFVAFLVLFIALASFKRIEQPGSSSSATPAGWGGPEGMSTSGRWNGQILGQGVISALGGTLDSTFGVFEIQQGVMAFTPEGAAAPNWTSPCNVLTVAQRGLISLNGADVAISWQTGPNSWQQVLCNVSRERINRFSDNDFKEMRQRSYAGEFVACLAANGARLQQ